MQFKKKFASGGGPTWPAILCGGSKMSCVYIKISPVTRAIKKIYFIIFNYFSINYLLFVHVLT